MNPKKHLAVNLAGIKLKNPVIAASGCYGYGRDYLPWISPEEWGGITLKGTTLHPRKGNYPPRLAETPSGLINAVGLQNPGIDLVMEKEIPALRAYDVAVIVNIAGETMAEYVMLAKKLAKAEGVDALELNVSCPNVEKGGLSFGTDPAVVGELVSQVRSCYSGPLIVKLSYQGHALSDIALSAERAGADAISLINTVRAMVIDTEKNKPVLCTGAGGLSGPAIRPIAVCAVWEVSAAVGIPVIGMGGIRDAGDALQFIMAGARAVSIGTANFVNPLVVKETVQGIEDFLLRKDYCSVDEISGLARG